MSESDSPVHHDHASHQLRLTFLRAAAVTIGVFTVISLLASLVDPTLPPYTIPLQIGLALSCAISFWMGRRGLATVGGLVLSISLIIAITFAGTPKELVERPLGVSYMIAILVAGMVSGASAVLLTSGISLALLTTFALMYGAFQDSSSTYIITTMLIILVSGGLATLIFRSQQRLLMRAQEQTQQAVMARHDLEERGAALQTSNSQLLEANTAQLAMLQTIAELETPAIPLLDGVLVVPLVGHLDTRRMDHLRISVLNSIYTQKVHTVILDITGIHLIDTGVTQNLQELGQAVGLLGAKVMMTGISPEIASTIVSLGLDFNDFETCAHLQDGVGRILSRN
ncbi:MAG: STAS domain-containing protein [Herpetosiphonaceae bacterium]|nr:STAS domain-containing protein [Herpetosiphonaceae bacterium]